MNYRKSILITKLQNGKVEVDAFLNDFSISLRTLKNDVDEINERMDKATIRFHHGFIEVNHNDEFIVQSNLLLYDHDLYTYKMTKDERTSIESILMLFSSNYVTANDFSTQLSVSRGTIINDMNDLRIRMKPYELKLVSRTNHGFTIHGNEVHIRKYICDIMNIDYVKMNSTYGILLENLLRADINVDDVSKELIHMMEGTNTVLNDESYRRILNYLFVTIKRMKQEKYMKTKETKEENPIHRAFLQRVIAPYAQVEYITHGEVCIFATTLCSLRTMKDTYSQVDTQTNEHIKISAFVWDICKRLDILEQFGYENYRVLYSHIVSTIYHLKSNMVIQKNPLYDELEQMYPHIFNCIEEDIHIIEELIDKKMDRNDISYIAMHIASVMETKDDTYQPLHAVLVCPTGRCVSLLLKARVLKYFSIVIDDVMPVYKISQKMNTDFIISTVPLSHHQIPVIVVNQMFLQEDIEKMQTFIQRIYKQSKKKSTIKVIEEYVQEYQTITMCQHNVDLQLDELNNRYQIVNDKKSKQYFYKMLEEAHILLDYEANTWRDAIEASGQLLLNTGDLTPSYIKKMIQLVEENGPYIVFGPGFVVAHAGPKDGANRVGISFVRLKKELQFEKDGVKVKFIICLSIPDKDSHVFLMFQMYKCLTNVRIFNFLKDAKSKDEIRSIIRIFELDNDENSQ